MRTKSELRRLVHGKPEILVEEYLAQQKAIEIMREALEKISNKWTDIPEVKVDSVKLSKQALEESKKVLGE